MAILTFGPLSDPWTYDQESRTYDLSRSTGTSASGDNDGPSSQKTKYTFATSNGPPDTKVMISPSLAALVIVDMQNFFLHPKCRDHPNGLAAVEPTAKVIARCRELGVEVRSSQNQGAKRRRHSLHSAKDEKMKTLTNATDHLAKLVPDRA